jgi:hypothetical protein
MQPIAVRSQSILAKKLGRVGNVMKVLSIAAVVAAGLLLAPAGAEAAIVYGLTDNNRLIRFDSATPGVLTGVAPIAGRINNEDLIGIDFRPSDNNLYAVGEFGTIYTINPNTAFAAAAGTLVADPGDPTNPFAGLQGSRFGLDFNPQADRLRITSDTGQNLRVNASTGQTFTDTNITSPGAIVGVAYTNNLPGATSTTLYGIDSAATGHRLVQFTGSPNDGNVTGVGPLGISNSSLVGFDILSVGPQTAFAALQREDRGVSELYTINLTTGSATLVGTIGGGDLIDGIAVVIPEPAALSLLGVGALALIRRR